MGRLAIVSWLAATWLLLACVPALAHANLVGATPPQGGEVSKPPEQVELRFSEPVDAEFDPVVVRDFHRRTRRGGTIRLRRGSCGRGPAV